MGNRVVFCGLVAAVNASLGVTAGADPEYHWQRVYSCEGEAAIVESFKSDNSLHRITIKNDNINVYLGLGYRMQPQGKGNPTHPYGQSFQGFSAVVSHFWRGDEKVGPFVTAHVFPDHGGLKVAVDVEPFYRCNYDLNYGDSSGQTHTIFAPIGVSCPDLEPSYSFRDASGGVDTRTSRNWFFQNCQNSGR
jgi:hypothetical protein